MSRYRNKIRENLLEEIIKSLVPIIQKVKIWRIHVSGRLVETEALQ
jgi:hypothetical protein